MLVQLVWPNCNFLGGQWFDDRTIDSFWVECSPVEGALIVTTYLQSSDQRIHPPGPAIPRKDNQLWQYFLISRDLSYVWSSRRSYPFSGQWGGYCPFRELPEPIVITRLEELRSIEILPECRQTLG